MTTTPSPKSSKSSWTPWSETHMAGRFCVSCAKESLVVKCGGCSEVGLETWYCPDCLENDIECVRCQQREEGPISSFMSPLVASSFDVLSNQSENAVLNFGVFKTALEASDSISDSMTTWLPSLLNDCATIASNGFYGESEPVRRNSAPPVQRPSPPATPPSEGATRRHTAPSQVSPRFVSTRQFVKRGTRTTDSAVYTLDEVSSTPTPPPPPPPPSSPPPFSTQTSSLPVPVVARAASHPLTAVLRKLAEAQKGGSCNNKWVEEEVDVCAICLEPPEDPIEMPCLHAYCARCVAALRERELKQVCPLCRGPLSSQSEADALYEDASRLFLPVQRAVERGRCTWKCLPLPLQADLDKSMALLRKASSQGHPRARACLGLGKRVVLQGLVMSGVEYIDEKGQGGQNSSLFDGASASVDASTASWSSPWSSRGAMSPKQKKGDDISSVPRDLNGAEGVVCEFDDETNHFVVQLRDGGQKVRVKAENIRMER